MKQPDMNAIIAELISMSREEWKQIIESKEKTPFIGVRQTIARALYEGKLEDTLKLMAHASPPPEDSRKKKTK